MDWTQITIALIGAGGITGLFLISEKKANAALKNMQIIIDNLQAQNDKLQKQRDADTIERTKLYEGNSSLHKQLDDANTKAAMGEMKRCDRIMCDKRIPPLADRWNMDKMPEITGMSEEES